MALIGVDDVFKDCVKQRKALGYSAAAAQQACSYPPGFAFFGEPVSAEPPKKPPEEEPPPEEPPPEEPPAEEPPPEPQAQSKKQEREGDGEPEPWIPRRRKGPGYPQHPAYGFFKSAGTTESRGVEKSSEGLSEGLWNPLPAWGGKDLTPGFVPVRDVRGDAWAWSKETAASGRRPSQDRAGWEEYASRVGLTSDQMEKGWRFIQGTFEGYVHVVAEARKIFEFSGQPYGGYYLQIPHEFKVKMPQMGSGMDPSWPWRTKEAARVYDTAVRLVRKFKNLDLLKLYELALRYSKISTYELSPEDDAILGIALQWLLSGKEALPQAPDIPTQRSAYGMKGTRVAHGRSLAPRGAP